MNGAIENLLRDIIYLINVEDATTLIALGLDEFMLNVYNLIMDIQVLIMQPVAYTILAIFILLEIQKISTKVEQAGGAPTLGFELIFKTLVKLIICKIVVDNVQLILDAILGVSNMLVTDIFRYSQDQQIAGQIIETFMSHIRSFNFWQRMTMFMNLLIVSLVALVLKVFIEVTLYIRFFELYIFAAIAPIPVATMPNEEFSSIGKSYFKGFVAVGLQGVFLALVLAIYPAILDGILTRSSIGSVGGGIPLRGPYVIMGSLLLYMLVIFLTINKTKQWAKSVVNVS